MIKNFLLVLFSFVVSALIYGITLWGLDQLSSYLRGGGTGNIIGVIVVFLSHLGFGFILFPLFFVIVFLTVKKFYETHWGSGHNT